MVKVTPFTQHSGIVVLEQGDGTCRARLTADLHHLNDWDAVHGGALCTLADTAMGHAFVSMRPKDHWGATVDMSISFIAPARGTLDCVGRVVSYGNRLVFTDAEIYDVTGQLVARASGTFAVRPQK